MDDDDDDDNDEDDEDDVDDNDDDDDDDDDDLRCKNLEDKKNFHEFCWTNNRTL